MASSVFHWCISDLFLFSERLVIWDESIAVPWRSHSVWLNRVPELDPCGLRWSEGQQSERGPLKPFLPPLPAAALNQKPVASVATPETQGVKGCWLLFCFLLPNTIEHTHTGLTPLTTRHEGLSPPKFIPGVCACVWLRVGSKTLCCACTERHATQHTAR